MGLVSRTGDKGELIYGKSTEPLLPYRDKISFMGGFLHANAPKNDPHICSDMWLTGAPLQNPKPGTFNTAGLDQVVAEHTKKYCRQPSLVLSTDAGTGYLSRTATLSYGLDGNPVPAENNPRRIFNRLFRADAGSRQAARESLQRQMKLVDAVNASAKALDQWLGATDRDRMDQYMTSLNEVEGRLAASERWIDVPLKPQDYSRLTLDADTDGDPGEYYRAMYDLIALAFDADITRSVTFMLSREDGMGIADTFPLKLGLSMLHHRLSHAPDKEGQLDFSRYDLFLSQQLAHSSGRLSEYKDRNGSVLDNTIVMYRQRRQRHPQCPQYSHPDRRRRRDAPQAWDLLEGCRAGNPHDQPASEHPAQHGHRGRNLLRQHGDHLQFDFPGLMQTTQLSWPASRGPSRATSTVCRLPWMAHARAAMDNRVCGSQKASVTNRHEFSSH